MEVMGILGFVFGLAALAQVIMLKKEVEALKEAIGKFGGEIDLEAKSD